MKHRALPQQQLGDPMSEEIRRAHAQAIDALQRDANERASVVIANVTLEDGVPKRVAHGLGRAPRIVVTSVPRGAVAAGYINEIRGGTDRAKLVTLQADSYGAEITIDVEFR